MKYFVLFLLFLSRAIASQPQYKLYCMYTPQFQTLYEHYFLPSIKDDFELIVKKIPEECPTGAFRSDGWDKTMLRKLELLEEAILAHQEDQIFFYSDVDIIFLKPILETCLMYLGDSDFVVQQGWPKNSLCAGFFVMRGNEKTLLWIKDAQSLLTDKECIDDQLALQEALKRKEEIKWDFLPSNEFPNGRRVLKEPAGYYSKESELVCDDSMLLFHATSCIGLDNKYDFLTRVQQRCFYED